MTRYSIWGRMGEDHDYYCLKSNVEQADVDKIIKHYLKTWREVEFREFAILHSQEGEKEIDMSTLTKAVQTHKQYLDVNLVLLIVVDPAKFEERKAYRADMFLEYDDKEK